MAAIACASCWNWSVRCFPPNKHRVNEHRRKEDERQEKMCHKSLRWFFRTVSITLLRWHVALAVSASILVAVQCRRAAKSNPSILFPFIVKYGISAIPPLLFMMNGCPHTIAGIARGESERERGTKRKSPIWWKWTNKNFIDDDADNVAAPDRSPPTITSTARRRANVQTAKVNFTCTKSFTTKHITSIGSSIQIYVIRLFSSRRRPSSVVAVIVVGYLISHQWQCSSNNMRSCENIFARAMRNKSGAYVIRGSCATFHVRHDICNFVRCEWASKQAHSCMCACEWVCVCLLHVNDSMCWRLQNPKHLPRYLISCT